jgi:hypothetical protein
MSVPYEWSNFLRRVFGFKQISFAEYFDNICSKSLSKIQTLTRQGFISNTDQYRFCDELENILDSQLRRDQLRSDFDATMSSRNFSSCFSGFTGKELWLLNCSDGSALHEIPRVESESEILLMFSDWLKK